MNNIAGFKVNEEKCIGCGACVKVCPGGLPSLDENRKPLITGADSFGWGGCWKCEHCLAVCPRGAIVVLGKKPVNSLPLPDIPEAERVMNSLIANRHSCRRFQGRNVDTAIINDMIGRLGNAPNGGNKQQVEFTLLDDIEQTHVFRNLAYKEMERLVKKGIYPEGFDKSSYDDMKRWERSVRPDMLFCGAPHLFIPHAPTGSGEWRQDVVIAGTYFELLCASRGLGCVMLTFPLGALNRMPEVKALLQIPEDHYMGMLIGFGYPEIRYARGTQRIVEEERIHRPEIKKTLDERIKR